MSRNLLRASFLCLIGLVLVLAVPALRAATAQDVGLDFVTNKTLDLANDTGTVNQGTAAVADFNNGYIDNAATPDHTLTVKANTDWKVQIKGDTTEASNGWVITAAANTGCPASKAVTTIEYSQDNFATTGTDLTATDVNLKTGTPTASQTVAIDYRTDLSWTVDTVQDNIGTGTSCTYDYDSVKYTLSAN